VNRGSMGSDNASSVGDALEVVLVDGDELRWRICSDSYKRIKTCYSFTFIKESYPS
jgi:hypothetical protein